MTVNLIFDYDGTIHNSMKTYAPAFRNTYQWLADNGYCPQKEFTDREISYWLGFNSTDMWQNFLPDSGNDIREKCRIMLGEDMAQRIENGEGELFPHAAETLQNLKAQGYTLIFLSNCRYQYMNRHARVFGLDRFFDHFYCCEAFGFLPKSDIFPKIRQAHAGMFIAVGDRFQDIDMAVKNGIRSVGCGYGYGTEGELSAADIIVNDVREIPDAVHRLVHTADVDEGD